MMAEGLGSLFGTEVPRIEHETSELVRQVFLGSY